MIEMTREAQRRSLGQGSLRASLGFPTSKTEALADGSDGGHGRHVVALKDREAPSVRPGQQEEMASSMTTWVAPGSDGARSQGSVGAAMQALQFKACMCDKCPYIANPRFDGTRAAGYCCMSCFKACLYQYRRRGEPGVHHGKHCTSWRAEHWVTQEGQDVELVDRLPIPTPAS